jgi:hypothetical protein
MSALDACGETMKTATPKTGGLGEVRLRHEETNEIILVPTPTNDPNDPLNWCVRTPILFSGPSHPN